MGFVGTLGLSYEYCHRHRNQKIQTRKTSFNKRFQNLDTFFSPLPPSMNPYSSKMRFPAASTLQVLGNISSKSHSFFVSLDGPTHLLLLYLLLADNSFLEQVSHLLTSYQHSQPFVQIIHLLCYSTQWSGRKQAFLPSLSFRLKSCITGKHPIFFLL